jgi:hypothetical protein
MYSLLVRKGGIIAFHDIIPSGYPKVYKFWNEVKEKYEYLEIIKNRNQNCYGIGIIFIK